MNLDHQRFFFLSGFITFFLSGIIVFFFVWKLLLPSSPDTFAMTQSDAISISLDTSVPSPQVEKSQTNMPVAAEQVPSSEPEETVKTPAPHEKSPVPEINDLFSTVKPANVAKKPKENTKQLSELNVLEEKVMATKRESQLFDKVKTLELAKSGVKMVSSSTGPAVNEYNAKIQGIIYSNFHPASGTEGFAARVRITLSPDGRLLAYRVLSYSGNAVFNAEVDWLKERLRQVELPAHPQGEEAVFEIILTAKE